MDIDDKTRIELRDWIDRAVRSTKGDSAMEMLMGTVLISAIALYSAERNSGAPIKTFSDAMWNAWSSVCAVGESGCPPITPSGRLITSALIMIGNPLYDRSKQEISRIIGGNVVAETNADTSLMQKELLTKLDLILERLNRIEDTGVDNHPGSVIGLKRS